MDRAKALLFNALWRLLWYILAICWIGHRHGTDVMVDCAAAGILLEGVIFGALRWHDKWKESE